MPCTSAWGGTDRREAWVSAEIWEKAQQVLHANRIMAKRNGWTPFLLRGLIKSGLCGLTFSGMRASARQPDHYYRCNGRQFARGLYGLTGKKCPAKSVNGRYIEQVVWADIETFLRNPGEILEKLRERLATKRDDEQLQETKLQQIRERYEHKAEERERMLSSSVAGGSIPTLWTSTWTPLTLKQPSCNARSSRRLEHYQRTTTRPSSDPRKAC